MTHVAKQWACQIEYSYTFLLFLFASNDDLDVATYRAQMCASSMTSGVMKLTDRYKSWVSALKNK